MVVAADQVENLMRVSATTPPQAVANSINKAIFEQNQMPIVRAIGAGAICPGRQGHRHRPWAGSNTRS